LSLLELLSDLRARGISLSVTDGQLKVSAPKGALTPALQLELRASKDALLAVLSATTSAVDAPSLAPIQAYDPTLPAPLSAAQHRLWFVEQLHPGTAFLNLPFTVRLQGNLNVQALEWAVAEVGRRHDALKSCIRVRGDTPVQVVGDDELTLTIVDASALSADARDQLVLDRRAAEMARPFDLAQAPLIRFILFRKSATDHWFTFVTNHVIFDGWSHDILFREIRELYEARTLGQAPSAPPPVRFADYVRWHEEWLTQPAQARQLDFWTNQLRDMPTILELPTDLPRPAEMSHRGINATWKMDGALVDQLRRVAQAHGATLNMLALASVELLLSRYASQRDFGVGIPVHGRGRPECQELIGMFVNTLVIRSDVAGAATFRDLLVRVRDRSIAALSNQDLPFEQLVQALQPARDRTRTPLYQAMFSYQEASRREYRMADLELEQVPSFSGSTATDATFWIRDHGTWAMAVMEMSADIFTQETADRWLRSWQSVLLSVAENPGMRLADVPILAEREVMELAALSVSDTVPVEPTLVHQLFERAAASTPTRTALIFENKSITFAELDARANQMAQILRERGVTVDSRVALCLPRNPDLVIAMLGVLKAGAGYVPIDPGLPAGRIETVISDAQPHAVVATTQTAATIVLDVNAVVLDRDASEIALQPTTAVAVTGQALDSLAYVIYTSGSTGQPKGVMVEHRNVANFFAAMRNTIALDDTGVWLAGTSTGFDISVLEILGCLCHGRAVVLIGDTVFGDARDASFGLAALASKHRVTHFQCTPSQARILLLNPDSKRLLGQLQQLILGGEALPQDLGDTLTALVPGEVINGYGPTEVTVYSTMARVRRGERITIGRPITNVDAFILDEDSHAVPRGSIGELCLGGASVARGYLGRDDLTAERFIPNPFTGDPTQRLYRTGDLARFDADGHIEYLGRNDQQVKIRGYRIELGEIELAMRGMAGVSDVVVLAFGDGAARHLVAFLRADAAVATEFVLRAQLRAVLPEYMVPSAFVYLDAFPLSSNGKIDRKAFREPSMARIADEYVPPKDEVDATLCGIWQSILNLPRVGITDDFFTLGGHSLLAVRIFNAIDESFGVRLPLTSLFDGPTIAQLSARIRVLRSNAFRAEQFTWSSVVPIQPNGSQPPFFCAAGMGGSPMNLIHLARALGPEQPFYGLQYRGIDGFLEPHKTIRAMATEFLDDMRRVQPEGPYFLGGFSMGGVVAYEIALILQERGEKVGLVVLLDTQSPTLPMWTLRERLLAHASRLQQEGPRYLIARTSDRWRRKLENLRLQLSVALSFRDRYATRHERVRRAGMEALYKYMPGIFAGDVMLLRAQSLLGPSDGIGYRMHESNGWREFVTGRLEVEEISMRHLEIASERAAPLAAAPINRALAHARQLASGQSTPLLAMIALEPVHAE
jgi:amino acid adenylation domain-containing protein